MAPEAPVSKFDRFLDRASKLAGVLLPLVVAIVGGFYTIQKDRNDEATRSAQQSQDDAQRRYSNLVALIPLLTSKDPLAVSTGLDIYTSEARANQAPLDLQDTIRRIANEQPNQALAAAAQVALEASKNQQAAECKFNPDGLYIHVANSSEQLADGQRLVNELRTGGLQVQGVQRVDALPAHTQLRYYFSDANNALAASITSALAKYGFDAVDRQDLSRRYLKPGCQPPAVFELWMGSNIVLQANGSVAK